MHLPVVFQNFPVVQGNFGISNPAVMSHEGGIRIPNVAVII